MVTKFALSMYGYAIAVTSFVLTCVLIAWQFKSVKRFAARKTSFPNRLPDERSTVNVNHLTSNSLSSRGSRSISARDLDVSISNYLKGAGSKSLSGTDTGVRVGSSLKWTRSKSLPGSLKDVSRRSSLKGLGSKSPSGSIDVSGSNPSKGSKSSDDLFNGQALVSVKLSTKVWPQEKYDSMKTIKGLEEKLRTLNTELKNIKPRLNIKKSDPLLIYFQGNLVGKNKDGGTLNTRKTYTNIKKEIIKKIEKLELDIETNKKLLTEEKIKFDKYESTVKEVTEDSVTIKQSAGTERISLENTIENNNKRIKQIDDATSDIMQIRDNIQLLKEHTLIQQKIYSNIPIKNRLTENFENMNKEISKYEEHIGALKNNIKYQESLITNIINGARNRIQTLDELMIDVKSNLMKIEEEFKDSLSISRSNGITDIDNSEMKNKVKLNEINMLELMNKKINENMLINKLILSD